MPYADPIKQKQYYRARYQAKRAAYKISNRQYRVDNPHYNKNRRKANPDKLRSYERKYQNNRSKNDPYWRLKNNLRARIRRAIKQTYKSATTIELLGATFEIVREHLTKLLLPGMTWENYGLHTWHIDHIVPCNAFDLTDPKQQRKCFHYTNLRPLWAKDNLIKSCKIIDDPPY